MQNELWSYNCKVRQFKNNKNNIYYKSLQSERTNSEKLGAVEFNMYIKGDCVIS